jgi:hypothetical protein
MTAKSSATTEAKFALTRKQRSQLSELLKEAKPGGSHDDAIDRLERLGVKFVEDMESLGFRPFIEDWDRGLSSRSYERTYNLRIEKLSNAELNKEWVGVGKANLLLKNLATDLVLCWKETTGRPLPRLTAEVLERCGVGYRRELAVIATSHPLWLILDAVGLKVSASTVNYLVCDARRRGGENIEVPRF